MYTNTVNLQRYSQMYPDMTIKELVEKLEQEKEEEEKKEKIRQENERKWFEDLIGEYVSINHNGCSFTVFKVDKPFNYALSINFMVYNVYRSPREGKFSIQKENRPINKYWIDNPYLQRSYGEKVNMKIITKEEYNKIEELYKTFGEDLKKLDI